MKIRPSPDIILICLQKFVGPLYDLENPFGHLDTSFNSLTVRGV